MIIAYSKYITIDITRELHLPEDAQHNRIGQEIATVDGLTYVHLPDDATLPIDQPAEIAASIRIVTPDAALLNAIKAASPQVRLINAAVAEKIAERYSVNIEIKLLRTAPSVEFEAYNTYTEECRAWGRAEKAKIGL